MVTILKKMQFFGKISSYSNQLFLIKNDDLDQNNCNFWSKMAHFEAENTILKAKMNKKWLFWIKIRTFSDLK